MIDYQINSNQPIPLRTKLSLIFGIVIVLVILAIFAFTFFVVLLSGGAILFFLNIFRPKRNKFFYNSYKQQSKAYKNHEDKNVIDI